MPDESMSMKEAKGAEDFQLPFAGMVRESNGGVTCWNASRSAGIDTIKQWRFHDEHQRRLQEESRGRA